MGIVTVQNSVIDGANGNWRVTTHRRSRRLHGGPFQRARRERNTAVDGGQEDSRPERYTEQRVAKSRQADRAGMNETSQAATSGAKPDSGIKIGDSIVVRFLDDNKTTSFVLSRDRHDAELLEERYEEARHVIAGSAERKAKMIVEPRHLDRRNGTLTVSLPGNASHVHF